MEDCPAVIPNEDLVVEEIAENPSGISESEITLPDGQIDLPSNVTDRSQIFMPIGIKSDDPRIYGKWMLFTNGDLYLQDYTWIQLQSLILDRLVLLLESSTTKKCRVRGRFQGVIKCYTGEDIEDIKRAGIAIQNITKDKVILHYKTNQASKDNLNRSYGDRFITKYMLTLCGGFYEKDELDRWQKVKGDIHEENSPERFIAQVKNSTHEKNSPRSCNEHVYLPPHKRGSLDSEMFPSQENAKRRYFYPIHGNTEEHDGIWSLFCKITDCFRNDKNELDRMWAEAKKLCNENVFSFISCETNAAFNPISKENPLRRAMSCVVKDYHDINILLQSGDKLRERTGYNLPLYFKICYLNKDGKKKFSNKYLYTDDRELYEYVDEQWQLLEKSDAT